MAWWAGGGLTAGRRTLRCPRELPQLTHPLTPLLTPVDPSVLHGCQEEALLQPSARDAFVQHLQGQSRNARFEDALYV